MPKPERQDDLREMERWLPAQLSGRRVLELACGTGYWTQFIAAVAARIVAIDAAPETLEIARKRVHQSEVSFLLGDAYRVSSAVGKFDAAMLGDGTVHRVLKNFPTERELRSLVDDIGRDAQFIRWQYYWALSYVTARR